MCYRIGTLGKTNDDDLGALIIEVPSRPEARKLLEVAPTGAPIQSPANEPYSGSLIIKVPSDAPDASPSYAPDASPFVSRMDGRD
ncbi:hypothetical protein SUGI_0019670 [Cryptomeria japonica]|nr:hypothetical protein SUGI_0019670 [Cryptomeria japonica]